MSKPKVFEKPAGVNDYLPDVARKLRAVETRVLACMSRWGYSEIVTPTLEFYDTVGIASSTSDNKLFKLLDRNGSTLVLRSDMTAPIARVVSSLLREEPFPIRLSYHGAVYRATPAEAGRDMEFFQTGLELVGDPSAEADAEVVALAIASLQAAGVERFKIALGHIGFLNGLMDAALPGRPDDQAMLKQRLLARDYVGYREELGKLGLDAQTASELEAILGLRGGDEICREAMKLCSHRTAIDSIRHLCEVWDILGDYGVCGHVMIDLTMVGDFDYYTGMILEGYAAGLGFPVCSGGRYDNLLQQFGRGAPATGFALKTNRILEAVSVDLDRQEQPRALIVYAAGQRPQAFAEAERLRQEGVSVVKVRMERADWDKGLAELPGGACRWNGVRYDRKVVFG